MHGKTRREQLTGEQTAAAANVEHAGARRQAAVAQELHMLAQVCSTWCE
jgi:hypothetical protein